MFGLDFYSFVSETSYTYTQRFKYEAHLAVENATPNILAIASQVTDWPHFQCKNLYQICEKSARSTSSTDNYLPCFKQVPVSAQRVINALSEFQLQPIDELIISTGSCWNRHPGTEFPRPRDLDRLFNKPMENIMPGYPNEYTIICTFVRDTWWGSLNITSSMHRHHRRPASPTAQWPMPSELQRDSKREFQFKSYLASPIFVFMAAFDAAILSMQIRSTQVRTENNRKGFITVSLSVSLLSGCTLRSYEFNHHKTSWKVIQDASVPRDGWSVWSTFVVVYAVFVLFSSEWRQRLELRMVPLDRLLTASSPAASFTWKVSLLD